MLRRWGVQLNKLDEEGVDPGLRLSHPTSK